MLKLNHVKSAQLLIVFCFSLCHFCSAINIKTSTNNQEETDYYKDRLWITFSSKSLVSSSGNLTDNDRLKRLYKEYEVTQISDIFSFAKSEYLKNLYEIKFKSKKIEKIIEEIEEEYSDLIKSYERVYVPKTLYEPEDHMWHLTRADPNEWLWHLIKIEADKAWDITRGCDKVKIAVIDDGFDISHPDLIGKIDPLYDFFSGTPLTPWGTSSHGNSVAGLLAGETTETGETPGGQYASIGFNSEMMLANWSNGLQKAVYASSVLKADIISISWYSGCSPNSSWLIAEQEILNNGTAIIRAAGNGQINCSGGPLYPFSGVEDDRTIVVSSTSKFDTHFDPTSGHANSHYPAVDLCAPGYHLLSLTNSQGSPWPYWGGWGGTSQSTPIVSGLAALMKSVNPDLVNDDIQDILRATSDPISDGDDSWDPYYGLVGAGRINAYKAIIGALEEGTKYIQNKIYNPGGGPMGSSVYEEIGVTRIVCGENVTTTLPIGDVIVNPSTAVTFKAPYEIKLSGGFEVKPNSFFEARIINSYCQ